MTRRTAYVLDQNLPRIIHSPPPQAGRAAAALAAAASAAPGAPCTSPENRAARPSLTMRSPGLSRSSPPSSTPPTSLPPPPLSLSLLPAASPLTCQPRRCAARAPALAGCRLQGQRPSVREGEPRGFTCCAPPMHGAAVKHALAQTQDIMHSAALQTHTGCSLQQRPALFAATLNLSPNLPSKQVIQWLAPRTRAYPGSRMAPPPPPCATTGSLPAWRASTWSRSVTRPEPCVCRPWPNSNLRRADGRASVFVSQR